MFTSHTTQTSLIASRKPNDGTTTTRQQRRQEASRKRKQPWVRALRLSLAASVAATGMMAGTAIPHAAADDGVALQDVAYRTSLRIESRATLIPRTTVPRHDVADPGRRNWTNVTFTNAFAEVPVVVTTTGPNDGPQPAIIRIRNVTRNGFQAVVVEPEGPNTPSHEATLMYWVAAEKGAYALPDGSMIEVGEVESRAQQGMFPDERSRSSWDNIAFEVPFEEPPVFLPQIQTINNEQNAIPTEHSQPFLAAAVRNIRVNGVEIALERSRTRRGGINLQNERIGYIAMSADRNDSTPYTDGLGQPGTVRWETHALERATRGIDNGPSRHDWTRRFRETPIPLVHKASRYGIHGGWIRVRRIQPSFLEFFIDEDYATDRDRSHTREDLSIMTMDQGAYAINLDTDGDGIVDPFDPDPNDPNNPGTPGDPNDPNDPGDVLGDRTIPSITGGSCATSAATGGETGFAALFLMGIAWGLRRRTPSLRRARSQDTGTQG